MMNQKIREVLKELAECYYLANDKPRRNTFLQAEMIVGSLEEDLTLESNLDSLSKGIGPSTKTIIQEILETSNCSRLQELRTKYPSQIVQTKQASFLREESSFYLLGDVGVKTNYSSGNSDIAKTASTLKEKGHKHIFIADQFQTDQNSYGLKERELNSYLKNIKQAQIDLDIKIFSGALVRISSFNEEVEKTLKILSSRLEFIIVDLDLKENELLDFIRFVKNISNKTIIEPSKLDESQIKTLDSSSFPFLFSTNLISESYFTKFNSLKKVAFSSDNTFNDSLIKQCIEYLKLSKSQVLNCIPAPFKSTSVSNTIVGVK